MTSPTLEEVNAALVKALSNACINDGGTAYDGEDDIVGYRVCCGASSFRPHETGCWMIEARAALDLARAAAVKEG